MVSSSFVAGDLVSESSYEVDGEALDVKVKNCVGLVFVHVPLSSQPVNRLVRATFGDQLQQILRPARSGGHRSKYVKTLIDLSKFMVPVHT